jgi:hypothetical protein
MLSGGITFGTNISTDLPKFSANPNQTYRAAVLHYVDANQTLQPIIRAERTHFHSVPEGQQGLGGFVCLSTDESIAPCCKNTGIFNDPLFKIAIPIILYPTTFQGEIIANGAPDIQVLVIYERGWGKLNTINRTYPLQSNDFTISGKKQGKGISLDYMPAGPAYWQTDQAMFGQFLGKAKALFEGPGLAGIDRMIGRKVTVQDVENAVRAAAGLPPALPPPPQMPQMPQMPQIPLMPISGGGGYPMPVVAAVSLPQIPAPVAVLPQTGPASAAQISALSGLLAPVD